MKKQFFRVLALALSVCALPLTGCGHDHRFTGKVAEEEYLCTAATCLAPATYYYSCECGEKGATTFEKGEKAPHKYTAEVEEAKYLKTAASCLEGAVYYKSCADCGRKGYGDKTFQSEALGDHAYTNENPDWAFVKSEATKTSAAVFYKSCVCGQVGEDTFTHGEPLREYTDEEKEALTPTTLTMTLYDTENSVYGFTYHTEAEPLRPVIQIAKGDSLSGDFEEYACSVEVASSTRRSGGAFNYYLVKAEVPMEDVSTYTYRAYDKYADVGTDAVTIQTKDLQAESFSFAHVSDSQSANYSGTYFAQVLNQLSGKVDFLLHTGDVVEYSQYEEDWTEMLHGNFSYFSKLPIMALAGNHDSIYQAGDNELYEHFNYPVVNGQDTEENKGQYYSFTYGNAKFFMLTSNASNGGKIDDDQLQWLIEELENNTATWTIVGIHQPMYSPGRYGSLPDLKGKSLSLRAQLSGIFAQYGVDLVLQGHDHVLSRTYPIDGNGLPATETWKEVDSVQYSQDPSGVIYLMNGPASDQARGPVAEAEESLYYYKKQSSMRSFATITINGNRLTVSAQYVSGSTATPYADATWGIEKTA